MPPFLQNILTNVKETFGKLDKTKKIILAGVGVFLLIVLAVTFSVSTSKPGVILFEDLSQAQFSNITKKIEGMGISYTTSRGKDIFVNSKDRNKVIQMLAQSKLLPTGVEGWKIFDIKSWDETRFDKDIKKQRAIMGALQGSIESLEKVKSAIVNIAIPEPELFQNNISPVKASVILHLSAGVENLSKREVKGIMTIVERAVPKLKMENISIADSSGKILFSPLDDYENEKMMEMKLVKLKLSIQEQERVKKLVDIRKTLLRIYPKRVDILRMDLELNWDKEDYKAKTYAPIVMKSDDPKTPYNEEVVKESLPLSEQKTSEKFIGKGFTPDGPAGTDPNIPPGYKDTDYQKALYEKIKNTKNHLVNEKDSVVSKQPWSIKKINLGVIIDGIWVKKGEKEDGSGYIREYIPVSKEEIKKVKKTLASSLGFVSERGDLLSVVHIPRDHSAEFLLEDEALQKRRLIRNVLMASLISLVALFAIFLIYRAIAKERERRRRQREEEQARRQALMREAALRVAEDQGAEYELSADEKARKEMLENAINLAREKPEDVALLLRTWLSEE